jgi:hypothetical protein
MPAELEDVEPIDFESMSADDWEEYLESHPSRSLLVTDPDGTHEFSYDGETGAVVFWAHGTRGYDRDGTRAALEAAAGGSDGLALAGSSGGEEDE